VTALPDDLAVLLAALHAERNPGVYVYCALPADTDPGSLPAIGLFREREGVTAILTEAAASLAGLRPAFRAAWITLSVHSDLHAVGLTAAIAAALAAEGISCNVVAAVHHDHLFVPIDRADDAIAALDRLQAAAQRPSSS
jgi:hypothetical protein